MPGIEQPNKATQPASSFRGKIKCWSRYVEEIVLVSDEEIKAAVSTLYRAGLLVEPSGSAAFAAIANDRIPDIAGRNVVVILSGGNIGKDELTNFPD
uniref:L-serine deaminase n=1 Tax=Oncorhynchus kisutch TaxID=8019 RepID=A0A8C7GED0_ONCKI